MQPENLSDKDGQLKSLSSQTPISDAKIGHHQGGSHMLDSFARFHCDLAADSQVLRTGRSLSASENMG